MIVFEHYEYRYETQAHPEIGKSFLFMPTVQLDRIGHDTDSLPVYSSS
jgi:hypothetical protein